MAYYVATMQSSGAPRTQKMDWRVARGPSDMRDTLCGDPATVKCFAHSENEKELMSEVLPTFETFDEATLQSSSALRTQEME